MPRVLVIVPFPFDDEGLANRRQQQKECKLGDGFDFHYEAVKAGPALFDSYHDYLLADVGICEAGLRAQEEGFDAVCIDTVSDSGLAPLRSVLDIPVIGPGRASYLMALFLGNRFSIVTQWDPWIASYEKSLQEYGLRDKLASVRSINVPPDVKNLLGGKEEEVFPKLEAAGIQCIEEDGADVILLGSTTMHQSHGFLASRLPVPVINPGPLTYKLAETVLALGLTHSRRAYQQPHEPKPEMMTTMLDAAQAFEG